MIYIYTLSCPLTRDIMYVGKTYDLKIRFGQHLNDKRKKTKVKSWISSLKAKGLSPIMEVIDVGDESDWRWLECYWMEQLVAWGFTLKNMVIGGMGVYRTANETKLKISNTLRGRKFPDKIQFTVKVFQYDLNGIYIKSFSSITSAEKETGGIVNNIINAIKTKRSCVGFQWRYQKEIVLAYKMKKSDNLIASNARMKPVVELDANGCIINEFSSIKNCEKQTSCLNIFYVCSGIRPHSKNRFFKFKEALNKLEHGKYRDKIKSLGC